MISLSLSQPMSFLTLVFPIPLPIPLRRGREGVAAWGLGWEQRPTHHRPGASDTQLVSWNLTPPRAAIRAHLSSGLTLCFHWKQFVGDSISNTVRRHSYFRLGYFLFASQYRKFVLNGVPKFLLASPFVSGVHVSTNNTQERPWMVDV